MLIKHLFFQGLDFSERKIFTLSLEDVFVLIFLQLDKLLECEYTYPLGMENGAISDSQISASSQWDSSFSPKNGRLHLRDEQGPEKKGAWAVRTNNDKQWLQIDLRDQQTKVTRVGTQGRNGFNQWVTKYKLQYGNDEGSLQYFKEEGQSADKVGLQISCKCSQNVCFHTSCTILSILRACVFSPD